MVLRVFNRLPGRPRLKPLRQRAVTAVAEPPDLVVSRDLEATFINLVGTNGSTRHGFSLGIWQSTLTPPRFRGEEIDQIDTNTGNLRIVLSTTPAVQTWDFIMLQLDDLLPVELGWVEGASMHYRITDGPAYQLYQPYLAARVGQRVRWTVSAGPRI